MKPKMESKNCMGRIQIPGYYHSMHMYNIIHVLTSYVELEILIIVIDSRTTSYVELDKGNSNYSYRQQNDLLCRA